MKRHLLTVATLLALSTVGAAAIAADTVQPVGTPRASLDANGDGVVDKAEAAKSPKLAGRFAQLDRNADGKLDRAELKQARGPGPRRGHGGPGGHGGGLERLDTDKDGRISRAEFAAGEAKWAERAAKSGRPVDANAKPKLDFAALDLNRDGYVTRAELKMFHERRKPQREAEKRSRQEAAFQAADLNGDGRLSKVEAAQASPRLAERFSWLDDNRDGVLSKSEVEGELRGPRPDGADGKGPRASR